MAKKSPNTAKAIVWGERSRLEMSGPTTSVSYHVFQMVPEAEREQLLTDMREWHESVLDERGSAGAA